MYAAPIGEYRGPFQVASGWAVYRVLQRAPAQKRTLQTAFEDVESDYEQYNTQLLFDQFLGRVRERNPIEVYHAEYTVQFMQEIS